MTDTKYTRQSELEQQLAERDHRIAELERELSAYRREAKDGATDIANYKTQLRQTTERLDRLVAAVETYDRETAAYVRNDSRPRWEAKHASRKALDATIADAKGGGK